MPLDLTDPATSLPPLPTDFDAPRSARNSVEPLEETSESFYDKFMQDVREDISEERMHDLVFDFLIGEGFGDVAQVLAEESGRPLPDKLRSPPFLEERTAIRDAIQAGELALAIDLIHALCPGLLARDKELHFVILRQNLVELIRKKQLDEALEFAQKHLADKCDQSAEQMQKLEQTYALLAFDAPENSPFGHLMSSSQKQMLAHSVNQRLLTELDVTPQSRFEQLLQLMIWNTGRADVHLSSKASFKATHELFRKNSPFEEFMEESV